jgi:histidine phosphotransferase ChpT
LSPQLQEALEGSASVASLSPRSVQAYVVGRFAEQFGFKLTHNQPEPDRLDFVLRAAEAAVATQPSVANGM